MSVSRRRWCVAYGSFRRFVPTTGADQKQGNGIARRVARGNGLAPGPHTRRRGLHHDRRPRADIRSLPESSRSRTCSFRGWMSAQSLVRSCRSSLRPPNHRRPGHARPAGDDNDRGDRRRLAIPASRMDRRASSHRPHRRGSCLPAGAPATGREGLLTQLRRSHGAALGPISSSIDRSLRSGHSKGFCVELGDWRAAVNDVAVPVVLDEARQSVLTLACGGPPQILTRRKLEELGRQMVAGGNRGGNRDREDVRAQGVSYRFVIVRRRLAPTGRAVRRFARANHHWRASD